jgi:hypothetical protein
MRCSGSLGACRPAAVPRVAWRAHAAQTPTLLRVPRLRAPARARLCAVHVAAAATVSESGEGEQLRVFEADEPPGVDVLSFAGEPEAPLCVLRAAALAVHVRGSLR